MASILVTYKICLYLILKKVKSGRKDKNIATVRRNINLEHGTAPINGFPYTWVSNLKQRDICTDPDKTDFCILCIIL